MYQIHVEACKKPSVYRVLQINPHADLYTLDVMLTVAFEIDDTEEATFQSVVLNGKRNNDFISLYDEDGDYNDSTISDLFQKVNDEMQYITDTDMELKLVFERTLNVAAERNIILSGSGSLFEGRSDVDVQALNKELEFELAVEEAIMDDLFTKLFEDETSDYKALLQSAAELNQLKPWHYFENGEIVALQLDDMKYFVSVMGAGEQEYGLMIYDELFGYASLEKLIMNEPLPYDFPANLSGLTVNYVNRDELEKEDYQLIKNEGMSFRGKKQWIAFRAFEPGFVATQPNACQIHILTRIIDAMIEVTEMRIDGWQYPDVPLNGFPLFELDDADDVYLRGNIQLERVTEAPLEIDVNDLNIAKVKKKEKSTLQMEFDLFYMLSGMVNDDGVLVYPLVHAVADHVTGELIGYDLIPLPKYPVVQQQLFLQLLLEFPVLPQKILVTRDLKHTLQPVAKLFKVELVESTLPAISEFRETLAIYLQ